MKTCFEAGIRLFDCFAYHQRRELNSMRIFTSLTQESILAFCHSKFLAQSQNYFARFLYSIFFPVMFLFCVFFIMLASVSII